MTLIGSLLRRHVPPAQLNRRLDQNPNAIKKAPVLTFTLGILAALFTGAVQARDDGRYSQSQDLTANNGDCIMLPSDIGRPSLSEA